MTIPIPCISESALQDANKTNNLLDKLFEQVVNYSKESMEWPVLYTHGNITTRHIKKKSQKDPHQFLQRSSIHSSDQVTYDQLRSMLFLNHTLNEPKYVEMLTEVKLLNNINNEADIFWLSFKTPSLSSSREFIELVATREIGRSFMIVSQPVSSSTKVKNGHVRGAYQAWEIVTEKENEKGEKVVEWICVQHSSAGGLIPSFLSDWVAGRDFHHDVDSIIKCIYKK